MKGQQPRSRLDEIRGKVWHAHSTGSKGAAASSATPQPTTTPPPTAPTTSSHLAHQQLRCQAHPHRILLSHTSHRGAKQVASAHSANLPPPPRPPPQYHQRHRSCKIVRLNRNPKGIGRVESARKECLAMRESCAGAQRATAAAERLTLHLRTRPFRGSC